MVVKKLISNVRLRGRDDNTLSIMI